MYKKKGVKEINESVTGDWTIISGKVSSQNSIIAPFSKNKCEWHSAEEQYYGRKGRYSHGWKFNKMVYSKKPFEISDSSGKILIDPRIDKCMVEDNKFYWNDTNDNRGLKILERLSGEYYTPKNPFIEGKITAENDVKWHRHDDEVRYIEKIIRQDDEVVCEGRIEEHKGKRILVPRENGLKVIVISDKFLSLMRNNMLRIFVQIGAIYLLAYILII